jgi:hypothetical protein
MQPSEIRVGATYRGLCDSQRVVKERGAVWLSYCACHETPKGAIGKPVRLHVTNFAAWAVEEVRDAG